MVNQELDKEIKDFSIFLHSEKSLKEITSTKFFWCVSYEKINLTSSKHSSKFVRLRELSRVLLNISSTSAFIERFFSIAGIISKIRSPNMSANLIATRSMLKSNIEILEELNETFE